MASARLPDSAQSRGAIAIFVPSLRGGGAERVALNLAEAFSEAGHDVDLVVMSREGPLLAKVPEEVRIVDLLAGRARHAARPLRRYLKSARARALIAIGFDANLIACFASLGLTKRPTLILTVHNTLSYVQRNWPAWLRAANLTAISLLYRTADAVVAVSKGVADDLAGLASIPGPTVIYNPVIRRDFEEALAREPSHPWFGDSSTPVILSVGSLTKQKNHELLIRAFAILAKERPARLMILGEGPLRPELEALISQLGLADRVDMPGFRDEPQNLMGRADIFVLSSDWEGFGNVLVEALAAGAPIVSTDCPHGPSEILEGGKWGKLVRPNDPEALADAMHAALSEPRIDGRLRAREFSVPRIADQYLRLLRQ